MKLNDIDNPLLHASELISLVGSELDPQLEIANLKAEMMVTDINLHRASHYEAVKKKIISLYREKYQSEFESNHLDDEIIIRLNNDIQAVSQFIDRSAYNFISVFNSLYKDTDNYLDEEKCYAFFYQDFNRTKSNIYCLLKYINDQPNQEEIDTYINELIDQLNDTGRASITLKELILIYYPSIDDLSNRKKLQRYISTMCLEGHIEIKNISENEVLSINKFIEIRHTTHPTEDIIEKLKIADTNLTITNLIKPFDILTGNKPVLTANNVVNQPSNTNGCGDVEIIIDTDIESTYVKVMINGVHDKRITVKKDLAGRNTSVVRMLELLAEHGSISRRKCSEEKRWIQNKNNDVKKANKKLREILNVGDESKPLYIDTKTIRTNLELKAKPKSKADDALNHTKDDKDDDKKNKLLNSKPLEDYKEKIRLEKLEYMSEKI